MTAATDTPSSVEAVTASAPGKLILAGEHAVVYRRPALVAALDLRLEAVFRRRDTGDDGGVRLAIPSLGLDRELPWSEIVGHARHARDEWRAWCEGTGDGGFGRGTARRDEAHVVKVALGEAAAALGEERGPALDLRIDSQLPTGCGFGSSAAAAVALVAGYLALRTGTAPEERVEALALEVERRQHGMPSGADGATVLHGGLIWAEGSDDHWLRFSPFPGDSPVLRRLAVYDTGTPAEGTGAVVAEVARRAGAEPERFDALWDEMEAATRALRDLLAEGGDDPEAAGELIRRCQAALEEIGVVPPPVRRLVRRIEAAGGAAKISGAGSLDGPGAGSLIVHHPEPDGLAALAGLRRYPVRLGAPGLRLDTSPPGD